MCKHAVRVSGYCGNHRDAFDYIKTRRVRQVYIHLLMHCMAIWESVVTIATRALTC